MRGVRVSGILLPAVRLFFFLKVLNDLNDFKDFKNLT